MHGLTRLLLRDDTIREAVEAVDPGSSGDLICLEQIRPFLIAAICQQTPTVAVTSTYRQAEALTAMVAGLIGEDQVAYYPAWETLPHERLSPRSDTVGRRLEVLRRLSGNGEAPPPRVVVAPVRSLLQPQVKGLGSMSPVRIRTGATYQIQDLPTALVQAGYVRTDLVERRGQFAIRGGILDLFSPTTDSPVRIDFFGDVVEEIRSFSVADQRSTSVVFDEVVATPCREMLLTEQVQARARQLLPHHPELADMLERIGQGHGVEGMEALAPALTDGMEMLTDTLPADTVIVVCDPELVRARAVDLTATSDEFLRASWAAAAEGGSAPIDLGAAAYKSLSDVRQASRARGLGWWSLSPYGSDPDQGSFIVTAQRRATQTRDIQQGVDEVGQATSTGATVVVMTPGRGLAQRFHDLLTESGASAHLVQLADAEPKPGMVSIYQGSLSHGFSVPSLNLEVFTDTELSGTQAADKSTRRLPTRRKKEIDPLTLASGDLVVHDSHGVGRYVEMSTRTMSGVQREYLVIEYAASKRGQPGDRLYVPMDQLNLVSRYVGGEEPSLDRLGGADWNKRKARARKAVREIARELVQLYAARQSVTGFAFSPDTQWQKEMEDSFSFVETPDQLACIDEVKHDMEAITPMDRLICGDVGYGKTEIAVRAAFKAVMDGKQVAVLVPTTLLVQQHFATFAARCAGFPLTLAPLSRFQTAAEEKKTLAGLASGGVDIVIGTHRLLSQDVAFRDLGLVIIDEEQRFGVEHKEALKRLRLDADVLAMSATPIPRTLEMAVTGIRELSVIQTPPEERHPVLTFAGVWDPGQVTAAIRRELAREGQVFYVHNRVESINQAAAKVADLVPDARVGVAHGKMGERELEQVMTDFIDRRFDVLVCTTIIESGLDISTANTLIIERADTMGLSQLHQIRGRVGRGRDRGYAYFFYPPDKVLTATAHDRLATMAANTDLGAGMRIAMRDLEIRGAGNLLGADQSGHIGDVGFDLYLRLVGEAVAEYKSGSVAEVEPDMRIELPVEAHLPGDYIDSERLRLEMYRRIAAAVNDEQLGEVVAELTDRYGEPPTTVRALIDIAAFRIRAREAGVVEVVAQGKHIRFTPKQPLPESRRARLARMYPGSIVKPEGHVLVVSPTSDGFPIVTLKNAELLAWVSQVVASIFATD
ncbi:MAG: transcription-repair coupling factor [Propionibacteriaceae bacterium]|jgi:transcription-repair coupling factor (superfamily II helicase)|nr:transcription-repair coupling factor [Propionibacteriaceae bacterium]